MALSFLVINTTGLAHHAVVGSITPGRIMGYISFFSFFRAVGPPCMQSVDGPGIENYVDAVLRRIDHREAPGSHFL